LCLCHTHTVLGGVVVTVHGPSSCRRLDRSQRRPGQCRFYVAV